MTFSCQTILVSITIEQKDQLEIVEKRIQKHEQDLVEHQKTYETWSQKKADIIAEWAKDLSIKYTILGKPLTTIAKDIVERLKFIGVSNGGTKYVYESLDKEYKRGYNYGEYFSNVHSDVLEKSNVGNSTITDRKWKELTPDQKVEHVNNLERQRRDLDKKLESEGIDRSKPKTGPRQTQAKPPEEQQGPSEWSEALGRAEKVAQKIADGLHEIREKALVYKPLDPERDKLMAKEFDETITEGILSTLSWYLVPAKDDKWSLGHIRWMEVMIDRILQSKHAAGKMNQEYVTDPMTGRIMLDKKGNPIKRFISRERVGDAELPVFETSVKMMRCIKGLAWLEYWIEKDIGGYRRHRKWILHDYFADAAFGSIASGGPELKYTEEELKEDVEEDEEPISYEATVKIREKLVDAGLMTQEQKDEIED